MLPLRFATRWRIAGLFLLALVLVASLMPMFWIFPDRGDFVTWFVHVDKWLHGIAFVFLAVWFAGQYRRRSYWRIAVGLLAFGVLIEACQRMVTYRSADWLDIAADAAGIAVGIAIALAGLGGWSLWLENRFAVNRADTRGS